MKQAKHIIYHYSDETKWNLIIKPIKKGQKLLAPFIEGLTLTSEDNE